MVNQAKPDEQEQSDKKGRKLILSLWALVAFFLLFLLIYQFNVGEKTPCLGAVNIPGNESIGGDFTATNDQGESVTRDDVITGLSLIYFGYTFCPDICPIDTARNAEITDILAEKNIDITPIFVTIDPKRDTPAVMKEFTYYTHDKMIGLTGTPEQIDHLRSLFKVYAQKQTGEDEEFYLVDHSAFSYLVDENGFIAAYSRSQRAEEIAENIECQIAHFAKK